MEVQVPEHIQYKSLPYTYNACKTPILSLGSTLQSLLGITCVKAFILSGAKLLINTSFKEFLSGKASRYQMEHVVQRYWRGKALPNLRTAGDLLWFRFESGCGSSASYQNVPGFRLFLRKFSFLDQSKWYIQLVARNSKRYSVRGVVSCRIPDPIMCLIMF